MIKFVESSFVGGVASPGFKVGVLVSGAVIVVSEPAYFYKFSLTNV